MTTYLLLAAAAVSFAAPGVAAEPKAADPAASSAPTSAAAARSARPETRYCTRAEITGSRIAKRECRTRAEWLRDGFDPLAD